MNYIAENHKTKVFTLKIFAKFKKAQRYFQKLKLQMDIPIFFALKKGQSLQLKKNCPFGKFLNLHS
ncbi:hypothetical protein AB9T89_18395 [Flavobacterium oncorhynchi]|uniref:hypothetical protein n=1 Tax=Flavobacterium oncorhynchi TaxID=728056 RepID=UPI00351AA6B1